MQNNISPLVCGYAKIHQISIKTKAVGTGVRQGDFEQKAPLTIRRRIYIRREVVNGGRNQKNIINSLWFLKIDMSFYRPSYKRILSEPIKNFFGFGYAKIHRLTSAKASATLEISLPPLIALSGLPPPLPPQIADTVRRMLPA